MAKVQRKQGVKEPKITKIEISFPETEDNKKVLQYLDQLKGKPPRK